MKPLNHDINCYPSFQPNQVLTHSHLNRSMDYLEQQDRLTRQKLIGIGIACGLEISLNRSGDNIEIIISKGVGVSSEGFLIRLDESTCTQHDSPCSPDDSADTPEESIPPLDECICTHVRTFQDKAGYKAFIDPNSDPEVQYDILEILTDPSVTGDETIEELTEGHIQNKIVVLYLEILQQEVDKCLDESCDEKGKRWKFTVRKLLIHKSDMEKIIRRLHHLSPSENLDEYFNPGYHLHEIYVERFGFISGTDYLSLDNIENLDDFVYGYKVAIQDGASRLVSALHRMYELYKPLFDLQLGTTSDPFNDFPSGLVQIIEDNPLTVQYIYDFILDLKAAYDELASRLFDLTGKCSPNPNLFSRHLMLGELKTNNIGRFDPDSYPPGYFRHRFIPAPIHNRQSDLLLNIKQLIQRLVLMIGNFYGEELSSRLLNGESLLKITPDKDCSAPLGQRTIPFYYTVEAGKPSLPDYWDFESGKHGKQIYLTGYHDSGIIGVEGSRVSKPLLCDICRFPKLRIEGHVGRNLREVVTQLKELRKKYNLSFDIIALKLDHTFDSILLPDENVIADLQAIYTVHRNDLVCSIREFIDILESTKVSGPFIISFLLYQIARSGKMSSAVLWGIVIIIYRMYRLYIDALGNLAENGLPVNLKDFNLDRFKESYQNVNRMSSLLKYVINTWGDVESVVSASGDEAGSKQIYSDFLSIFLNYLELFLDKILDDAPQAQFETLYNLFIHRVKTLSLFSEFNKKIHGMEHIAGTSRGGTFILVYRDRTEYRDISGTVKDPAGKPVEGVDVIVNTESHGEFNTVTDAGGNYQIRVPGPQKGEKIYFTKAGYDFKAMSLADIDETKTRAVKLEGFKLDDFKLQISEKMCGDPAVNNNFLFNRMQAIAPNMKEAGISENLISVFTGLETFIPQTGRFNFVENADFQVVADFFLPHRLPVCGIETPAQDICPEKGDEKKKSIDLSIIAKQPYEKIGKNREFVSYITGMGGVKFSKAENQRRQKKG